MHKIITRIKGGNMKVKYKKYFKYRFLLQARRRFSWLEEFLKKFFPNISYSQLLIIGVFKYIFEIVSVYTIINLLVKDNKEISKQILFAIMIIYLIIYFVKSSVINYNRIIRPENIELIKLFPMTDLTRKVMLYSDACLFGLFKSFIKRILQVYLPFISIFEEPSILGALVGGVFLLCISILISIILISLKFIFTKGRLTIIKMSIYISISAFIYKLVNIITYYTVKLLKTFPYESLKNQDANQINIWINCIYQRMSENIDYVMNNYLFGRFSFIYHIKGLIEGRRFLVNLLMLLMYMVIFFIMALIVLRLYKDEEKTFLNKNDIVSVWTSFIEKLSNFLIKKFMKDKMSTYRLLLKDLSIFNNSREIINAKFFDIFGGISLWGLLGLLKGIESGLIYIEDGFYMNYFKAIVIFFVPLFVLIYFQDKIKNNFKFIFLVDGENRNIDLFKLTGYSMKNIFNEKLLIFFCFSAPIYGVFLLIYIVFCDFNMYETLSLLLNLIFIYYFATNFHLIGSLFITNFNWNHIDDQGNDVGQKYISNALIAVFQFFYSMVLAVVSILFLLQAWKSMILIFTVSILMFYKMRDVVLKKALIKLNIDIYD